MNTVPKSNLTAALAATAVVAVLAAAVVTHHDNTTQAAGAAQRPPAASTGVAETWTASATDLGGPYTDKTVRDIVHTSISGSGVRVRLSNAFGTVPITFDAVYLGKQSSGAALVPGSNHEVTFGGADFVTIPKGAEALSDPLPVTVPAQTNLAVSVHIAGATGEVTGHSDAQQENYYADGDTASAESASSYVYTIGSWFFVDAILVDSPERCGDIITFGDSITDGYQSTPGANRRWPDDLAARLLRQPTALQAAVANEGISGNEITADGAGVNAQARFDRDVLAQPGAHTVVFLEGINDIGNGLATSATQLIAADEQIIARAHADGLRILGGTLLPFAGAGYFSPQKDTVRQALNAWIRTSRAFDGVIDFDAQLRDPANPDRFLPAYDSGDHLHPNDAGYAAMADTVNLNALGCPS
jgi:lysophospholipase L1-like esterase